VWFRLSQNGAYRGTALCMAFGLAACSGMSATSQPAMPASALARPNADAPATSSVRFENHYAGSVEFSVYWSYDWNPIWVLADSSCVKPNQSWTPSVIYNHPDRGPQIEFKAVYRGPNCGDFLTTWARDVQLKGFTFANGKAHFDAEVSRYKSLCASQDGFPVIHCHKG
jgi:hypothetical protein